MGYSNAVLHVKMYPGADCESFYLPVIFKLRMKVRELKGIKEVFRLKETYIGSVKAK